MSTFKFYGTYKVYESGDIYSIKSERLLSGYVAPNGYKYVTLNKKKLAVHRLVADLFIDNPNKLPYVKHIDGNKLNNGISNLMWCSSEDVYQNVRNITLDHWILYSKLTVDQLSKNLGIPRSTVYKRVKQLEPQAYKIKQEKLLAQGIKYTKVNVK